MQRSRAGAAKTPPLGTSSLVVPPGAPSGVASAVSGAGAPVPLRSAETKLVDDVFLGRAGPTVRGRGLYEQMQRRLMVLLPICAYCKRIREGEAEPPPGAPPSRWGPMDARFTPGAGTGFTHCVCPDCYETELRPQIEALKLRSRAAG